MRLSRADSTQGSRRDPRHARGRLIDQRWRVALAAVLLATAGGTGAIWASGADRPADRPHSTSVGSPTPERPGSPRAIADPSVPPPAPPSAASAPPGSSRPASRASGPAPAAAVTGPSGGAGVAVPGIRLLYQDAGGLDADLDRVAELGVRWLRVDAAWSEIEASRGAFDYSRLDRAVRGARARNLEVLLVLSTTAAWARPAGTDWNHGPTTAAERAGFAAFSAATARRYRGDVAAYEVWNEPNLPIAWAPKPNAADYLALLKTAYPAVKRADPKAVVMTGGTGGGQTGIGTMPWYRRLYAGGMRAHCDAVAIHPYPDAPVAASGEMALAPKVRALMDANGDADKRLWGTETGAPTAGRPAIDEPRQAILLRQLYQRWARLKNAGPLLYYTLEDHGGTDREGHFGLLRVDRSRKPAYAALRDWTGAG